MPLKLVARVYTTWIKLNSVEGWRVRGSMHGVESRRSILDFLLVRLQGSRQACQAVVSNKTKLLFLCAQFFT